MTSFSARGLILSILRIAAFAPLVLMYVGASAQSIDYDPRRPAALKPCDEHAYRGREVEANRCYADLLASSTDLLIQAEAAWRTGDVQRANRAFRNALTSNQPAVHARSRWGRLFLETHQHDESLRLFREALELSPDDRYARLGLAHLYVEQFAGEAKPLLEKLIDEDPTLIEAQLLMARIALEEGRLDDARSRLDAALKATEAQKAPPLDVYAARAVLDLARGNESAAMLKNAWVARSLAFNPHNGAVFEDLADFEVMRRRYVEATPLLRKAIEVQPQRWSAHAALGANLLRLNLVDEARQHMQVAYEGDPYSPTIVNTLRLLDRVDEVDLISSQVRLPNASTPITLNLHLNKKESAPLQPYVQQLARDSILTFARRYGYQPQQAIDVQLYPDHDDFAVRVAALPGIGLLGVTFGGLIVMDSPSGRSTGDFHWGTTLWHEMAHVFTLSMTANRVPRWLSEGVSVFEEWRTGPTPGVVIAPPVMAALRAGRMLPIAELDGGFIRPEYPNQVQVSYTQAGLVCLFIEERWGFDRLPALIRQFERETSLPTALESTLKVSTDEFDRQFAEFVRERYRNTFARFEEWQQARQSARKSAEAEQWQAVIDSAQRATDIYPDDVSGDGPYLQLATAFDKLGQRDQAIQALQRYRQAGGWDPGALRQLAEWMQPSNAPAALEVLAAVNFADPLNASQHQLLGEQLLAARRGEESLQEFQVLLSLNPQDAPTAHFGMARALRLAGDIPASRRHLLDALETAPHFKPAQTLLLQMIKERQE
ncbi:MAG: tetratricopeptide repeat protein [Povalibacter sp.]